MNFEIADSVEYLANKKSSGTLTLSPICIIFQPESQTDQNAKDQSPTGKIIINDAHF